MRIVNWALMLLIAAVLIGCSGSQHSRDGLDSVGDRSVQAGKSLRPALGTDAGTANVDRTDSQSIFSSIPLDSANALDPALSSLFVARDSGLPSLSGMEADLSGSRSASGIGREWKDGADAFDKSSNAVVSNTSLSMFTGAGQRNWAIYMLPDVNGDLGFNKLTIETSNVNFTGGSPGFLVGLANYASGRWEILDRSESETYTKTLTAYADYVSPLGNVFLFVLTHDGNGIQLDRVGFDVDRSAPEVGSVSPSSGETGAQIQPVASVSNLVESWEWNFGGGASPNTSTEESPQITLGAEGSYSASVTALSRFGEAVFNFTLEVGPVTGAAPDVTAVSPLSGESGSIVTFIPEFSGTVDSWDWQFNGAGNPDSSTLESPDVELGEPGTYNCSVTATNLFGSDQFDFSFEVTQSGEAPVIISVDPLSGASGAEITFTPSYTGTVDTWDWQFGPAATPATSPDENPLETLGAPGIYECSVTASNSFGNDTLNFSFEVTGEPTFQWTEVDLSTITGTDGGWTPSVAVASNGNPMVAYANLDPNVLKPFVVIGDSTLDLAAPANWTNTDLLGAIVPPGFPAFTDIGFADGENLPRVSLVYIDPAAAVPAENSVVGFSALNITNEVPTWYNFYLSNIATEAQLARDGAIWTGIDYNPVNTHFGISNCVENSNSPTLNAQDLNYYDLTYDPASTPGNLTYTRWYGFGTGLTFPHMRYHDTTGEMQASLAGGLYLREDGGNWANPFANADSGLFGSIDILPGSYTGMSYQSISGTDTGLRYTELAEDDTVLADEDITIVTDTGSGEEIALVSQLAYMPDGTACIAYTEFDGSGTHVRFAIQDEGSWTIEDISASPNTFTPGSADVFVDLAHFANGNSIVCYSRFDSDVNTLRVAIRSS